MKAKIKRKIRKGTRLFTSLVEYSGIPHGYSTTVAWFAERMILASACLIALSFAAGIVFATKLSEPIVSSKFYNDALVRTQYAGEGIKVYSEQVIDTVSPVFLSLVKENRQEVDIEAQELAVRKEKLKNYLASKNSPFAEDDAAIHAFATSKNMKMMLAISFVESTFGKNCYYHNCSGIGGTPPNLKKYDSYEAWIKDFDKLLEDRYKDVPPEKFVGIYVQPGSPNWIYGVNQVLSELKEQEV